MTTGQEGQLNDILGISFWGFILIVLILAVIFAYIFIFIIEYRIRKKINMVTKNDFSGYKNINFIKNDSGILDVKGTFKGRKFKIKHLTDIWKKPKRIQIKVEHNVPNISKKINFIEYTINSKFIKREYLKLPNTTVDYLMQLIKVINRIENKPELLYSNNKETLYEIFGK